MSNTITPTVFYRTLNMEGLEIFYREAGPRAVHYGCNANAIPRWHPWWKALQKPHRMSFRVFSRVGSRISSAETSFGQRLMSI